MFVDYICNTHNYEVVVTISSDQVGPNQPTQAKLKATATTNQIQASKPVIQSANDNTEIGQKFNADGSFVTSV